MPSLLIQLVAQDVDVQAAVTGVAERADADAELMLVYLPLI